MPLPPPGQLRLTPARQATNDRRTYLFVGDATRGPIRVVTPANGASLPVPIDMGGERPFRLKILHINDLHGHIARLTKHDQDPTFARLVWRWRQLRHRYATDPGSAVLFLSAGDDMAGSVFDELLHESCCPPARHAGYHLYSAAGLDATVLGNHDLDMGNNLLAQAIRRDARFPVFSANLTGAPALSGLIHPAALLVVKGVRVGVIGLTTPAQIRRQPEETWQVVDPLPVLRRLLPAIRPFCDVLIILSHLGYSCAAHTATVHGVGDRELAQQLPPGMVDLIIGGHTHHLLNEDGLSLDNVVNGIPIVQAGMFGRFLGEVTVTLNGASTVTDARLKPTADLPVDEAFAERAVAPLVRQVWSAFTRRLGESTAHPDLSPEAVFNDFAAGESALANFITAGMMARARAHGLPADFALLDASIVRDGLPPGTLTFADWFALMPYADTLRLCHMTGRQLLALLHDNARRADRPRSPHTERGFLHFSSELRYAINLGDERSEARATSIMVNGRSLHEQLDGTFTAVCHSFLRQRSRPWQRLARDRGLPLVAMSDWTWQDTGLFLREALIQYIEQWGGVNAAGGARRDGRLRMHHTSDLTKKIDHEHSRVFHQPPVP